MDEMLKIGQVAKLYGVSLDTLRLYEKKGLLIPYVCEDNRYRYYSVHQLDTLELILNSKNAGMSLQDIARIIKSNNLSFYLEMFKEQKKELEEKIKLLERTKTYTSEKINVIEQLLHFENDYELEKNIQYADTDITLYLINIDLLIKIGSDAPQSEGMEILETWRRFTMSENQEPIEDVETALFSFQQSKAKSILEKDFIKLYEKGYVKTKKITSDYMKFTFLGTNTEIQQYITVIIKKTQAFNACVYVRNCYTFIHSKQENIYFIEIYLL